MFYCIRNIRIYQGSTVQRNSIVPSNCCVRLKDATKTYRSDFSTWCIPLHYLLISFYLKKKKEKERYGGRPREARANYIVRVKRSFKYHGFLGSTYFLHSCTYMYLTITRTLVCLIIIRYFFFYDNHRQIDELYQQSETNELFAASKFDLQVSNNSYSVKCRQELLLPGKCQNSSQLSFEITQSRSFFKALIRLMIVTMCMLRNLQFFSIPQTQSINNTIIVKKD